LELDKRKKEIVPKSDISQQTTDNNRILAEIQKLKNSDATDKKLIKETKDSITEVNINVKEAKSQGQEIARELDETKAERLNEERRREEEFGWIKKT